MKIVAFPFHDWRKGEIEGIRWRDGHLIETLAEHPAVEGILVIDRPVSMAERLGSRRSAFVRGSVVDERGTGRRVARITEVRSRLAVLDIALPDLMGPVLRRRQWWFDTFASEWVLDAIEWAAGRVVGSAPAVMAWTPTVAPAIERIGSSRVLFDSLDNWLIHPVLRQHAVEARSGYARILPSATVVVASAPASRTVLEQWTQHVEVIPNGVDPAVFATLHQRPADLPAGPIVGYAGSLAPRIDADLVAAVARALPDVTFVFIGRVMDKAAISAMRGLANIRILGNRHYSLLPGYLQHFDVAWIPHAVGAGETGGDPIKLYEYWAAGRQVVATPIDGLERWADQLHVVRDATGAIAAISGLLAGTIPPTPTDVPPDRTWRAIADRMLDLLDAGPPSGQGSANDR